MKTKIRVVLLRILCIPLIFGLATPISMLLSNTASAETFASAADSNRRIELWWYYNAFIQCLDNADQWNVSDPASVSQGKIVVSISNGSVNGPYMRSTSDSYSVAGIGEGGVADCKENDSEIFRQAFKIWGLDGVTIFCDSGLVVRDNGRDCKGDKSSNSTLRWSDNVIDGSQAGYQLTDAAVKKGSDYILKQIYGGSKPTLSNADYYLFYLQSFKNQCAYGQTISSTKPSGSDVYELTVFNSSKSLSGETAYVIGNVSKGSGNQPLTTNPNSGKTCEDMAAKTKEFAKDYGSQVTCTDKYKTGTAYTACIGGTQNSDITYCPKQYPSISSASSGQRVQDVTAERKACYVGQGNSGAEGCSAKYKDATLLRACIAGAQHQDDKDYCSTAYPGADVPNRPLDDSKNKACLDGQSIGEAIDTLDPSSVQTTGTADANGTKSCVIPSIGWLVCPAMGVVAGMVDGLYSLIEQFLTFDPAAVATGSGTSTAWEAMRNIANVGFVIFFLIIIFSQLSSVGITNYGVKKLLPRLIITAILVNVSFLVCQIAVDVSNILGSSLKDILDNIPAFNSKLSDDLASTGNIATNMVAQFMYTAVGAPVAGAAVGITLLTGPGLLIPILLAALLSILVTAGALILRQALIVLLIVVAPVAILAMLLPNTERFFKTWRKMFVAMLALYPMIALLFGASKLASEVLIQSNIANMGAIIGLGALVIPGFLIPGAVRASLGAIPAVGGFVGKLQSRAGGLVGNKAREFGKATPMARGMADRKRMKAEFRDKKYAEGVEAGGATSFLARGIPKLNKLTAAGKYADEALTRKAIFATDKAETDDINAQSLLLKLNGRKAATNGFTDHTGKSHTGEAATIAYLQSQLGGAMVKNDTITARAAYANLNAVSEGGADAGFSAIGATLRSPEGGQVSTATTESLQNYVKSMNIKGRDNRTNMWANGGADAINALDENFAGHIAGLTDEEVVNQTIGSFSQLANSPGTIDAVRAQRMLDNTNLQIKENKRVLLQRIVDAAGGAGGPAAPQPGGTPPPSNYQG